MSNSVEKFIIELGFDDKDALKGLKTFLGKLDQVNKKVVSNSNKAKKAAAQVSKSEDSINKKLREQNRLRNAILTAKKLGLDTTSEEGTLRRAKQEVTLVNKRVKLEERISKEKLRQHKIATSNLGGKGVVEDESERYYKTLEKYDKQRLENQKAADKAAKKYSERKRSNALKQSQDEQDAYQKALQNLEKRSKDERKIILDKKQATRKHTQTVIKDTLKIQDEKRKSIEAEKKARLKAAEQIATAEKKLDDQALARKLKHAQKVRNIYNSRQFQMLERDRPDAAADFRRQADSITQRMGNRDLSKRQVADLNMQMSDLQGRLRGTTLAVNRQTRAMVGLHTVQLGLKDSTRNLIRSYASLFALLAGSAAINRVGQNFEGMRAGMKVTGDSAQEVAGNLAFVRAEAKRLGLDLVDTSKSFVKIAAAAKGKLGLEDIQGIFTGVAEAGVVMQLTTDDMNGALRAIQQMVSKGQIYAEEFRQQLLERLPMAMRAMEIATGKTSAEISKMMEQGQLGIDVLPQFGAALRALANDNGALGEALATVRVQQARFTTAIQDAGDTIFQSGFGEGLRELFKTIVDETDKNRHSLIGLGQIYKWFFDTLGLGIKIISPLVDSVVYVFGEVAQIMDYINEKTGTKFAGTLSAIGIAALMMGSRIKGVVKLLSFIFRPVFLIVGGIIALFDEFFALFEKGRVGLIEKYILGEDLNLSLEDAMTAIRNFFSGLSGEGFGDFVEDISYQLTQAIINIDFSGLGKKIATFFSNIQWGSMLSGLVQAVFNLFTIFPRMIVGFTDGIVNAILEKVGLGFYTVDLSSNLNGMIDKVNNQISTERDKYFNTPAASLGVDGQTGATKTTQVENKVEFKFYEADLGSEQGRKILMDDIDQRLTDYWDRQTKESEIIGVYR